MSQDQNDNGFGNAAMQNASQKITKEEKLLTLLIVCSLAFCRNAAVMAVGLGLIGLASGFVISQLTKPVEDLYWSIKGLFDPAMTREVYLQHVHGQWGGYWAFPFLVGASLIAWGIWANRAGIRSHLKQARKFAIIYVVVSLIGACLMVIDLVISNGSSVGGLVGIIVGVAAASFTFLAVPAAVFGLQLVRWADASHAEHKHVLGEKEADGTEKAWFWGAFTIPQWAVRTGKWIAVGTPVIAAFIPLAGMFLGWRLPFIEFGSTVVITILLFLFLASASVGFRLWRYLQTRFEVWEATGEKEVLEGLIPIDEAKETKHARITATL